MYILPQFFSFLFCFILNVFQATHGVWLLKMHVTSFWVMVAGSRFPLLWCWLTGCTEPSYLLPFSASCFTQCEGWKAWDTTGSCWHKAKNNAPSIACCLETEVQKKTVKQPEGWWDNSPCQWRWHCMGQSSMGFPEHLATVGVVMLGGGGGGGE